MFVVKLSSRKMTPEYVLNVPNRQNLNKSKTRKSKETVLEVAIFDHKNIKTWPFCEVCI